MIKVVGMKTEGTNPDSYGDSSYADPDVEEAFLWKQFLMLSEKHSGKKKCQANEHCLYEQEHEKPACFHNPLPEHVKYFLDKA